MCVCVYLRRRRDEKESQKKMKPSDGREKEPRSHTEREKAKNPKNGTKRKKCYQNQRPRIRIETHKINDFSTIKNIHVILHPLAMEPMKEKK